jgi:hypothetical protein
VGIAVSGLRETILAHQTEPEPQVDWRSVLNGLDAIEQAVAELRALVKRQVAPEVDENGECLHPLSQRSDLSTFAEKVEMCGRCGEML